MGEGEHGYRLDPHRYPTMEKVLVPVTGEETNSERLSHVVVNFMCEPDCPRYAQRPGRIRFPGASLRMSSHWPAGMKGISLRMN